MKRYFLIDYENVSEGGLNELTRFQKKDQVEIFYSRDERLRLATARQITDRCQLKLCGLEPCQTKNALDFLICCRVGKILQKNKGKRTVIVIISKDNGFAPLKQTAGENAEILQASSLKDYFDQIPSAEEESKETDNPGLQEVYLKKMQKLNFGDNTRGVVDEIMASATSEELGKRLAAKFPQKGKNYFKMLENTNV